MRKIFVGLALLCAVFSVQAKSNVLYQWLQIGVNNRWMVRAISSADACPSIKMDNTRIPMDVMHTKSKDFPITVCQKTVQHTVQKASIEGVPIVLPKKEINKIVLLGDTGCRMKTGVTPQDCNDINHWPFSLISKNAAKFKPDLVIHVGDYLYRESMGTPHGDNWITWQADLFKPMNPLLKVAPLIFVRGNHESCERAGEGWTRLLDPFNFKHCYNHSPIYPIEIGGDTRLYVMDSANANDFVAPANEVEVFENYLQNVEKSTAKHTWLISHKPFWFVFDEDEVTQTYQNHILSTLETAWDNVNPQNLDVIISGHIHRMQTLNFAKERPPQVIVGAGGTSLDGQLDRTDLKGLVSDNMPLTEGVSLIRFGYMTMERQGDYWNAQMRDMHGRTLENCIFKDKKFSCTPSALEIKLEPKKRRLG